MPRHSKNWTGDASMDIADDLLQLVADSPLVTAQDSEVYQGLDAAWFRATGPDGATYYVHVSQASPREPRVVPGTPYREGDRVRSGAEGATYGQQGTIRIPKNAEGGRLYIHWDGNVMSVGYRLNSAVYQGLIRI